MEKRNLTIDIIKLILVLGVVLYHFGGSFPPSYLAGGAFVLPFFFMISGYFIGRSKNCPNAAKKYFFGCLKYLIFAIVVLFILEFIDSWIAGRDLQYVIESVFHPFNNFFYDFVFCNNLTIGGGHGWFLVALFFIALFHYLCCRFNKTRHYPVTAIVLLVISLCLSYFVTQLHIGEMRGNPVMFNGWIYGLPLWMLGYLYSSKEIGKKINKYAWAKYLFLAAAILFAYIQTVEYNALKNNSPAFFVSTVFAAFALLVFTTSFRIPCKAKYWDKRLVFNIYIIHVFVGTKVMEQMDLSDLARTFVTFAICIAVCQIYYLLQVLYKKGLIYIKRMRTVQTAPEDPKD